MGKEKKEILKRNFFIEVLESNLSIYIYKS